MAVYDGSLSRIMLHKYLALYFTDFQQWSEYRRTGYPVLPKTSSMLNDGILPSRLLYPGVQQIYNPENYQAAAGVLSFVFIKCGNTSNGEQIPSDVGNQFRAATFNIRYNADADKESGNGWDIRKGPVSEVVLTHQFDVVGTQEGDAGQLADLKRLLPGFDFTVYPYGGKGDLHNCATFYRTAVFEVLDSGVFWLSETSDEPSIGWDATDRRICQWTKFKVKETGKEFFFFNAHFYWRFEEAKRKSGPLIVQKIKEIADQSPVICVGDFNSTVGTPQIKAVKTLLHDAYDRTKTPRQGMEDTNMGGGVFQGTPKNRIDYIFLSSHFEVEDYKVLSDVYNVDRYPSDHLPVTSLLTLMD